MVRHQQCIETQLKLMPNIKKDIRDVTLQELTEFLIAQNEKPFRAKQIMEWLWVKNVMQFSEMTNLSKATREILSTHFAFYTIGIKTILKSKDGTIKTAFSLHDNAIVEGVLIPSGKRATACISSQAGCALGCTFCATGKLGFSRNLLATEIYDQVVHLTSICKENHETGLSNIVLMGMGEPLQNYNNVLKAIKKITDPAGMNISPNRITLSTVGITKMIRKLADDKVKFNLAISLHTADEEKRNKIIPINKTNSLQDLSEALQYFFKVTNTRITIEYLILDKFNDSLADAAKLAEFCKAFPCKINIIQYNAVQGTSYKKATEKSVSDFIRFLESKNLVINLRKSRGEDIDAACGQLAGKNM